MSPAASALNIIERLFIELVEYPQCLTVTSEESHGATKIVAATSYLPDHKRLIGRKGQSYYAMQTLVEAMGRKAGCRLLLPRYQDPSGTVEHLAKADRRPDMCTRLEALTADVLTHLPVGTWRQSWGWDMEDGYKANVTISCAEPWAPDLAKSFEVVMTAIGRRWQSYLAFCWRMQKEVAPAV